jgi:hypothetical protein
LHLHVSGISSPATLVIAFAADQDEKHTIVCHLVGAFGIVGKSLNSIIIGAENEMMPGKSWS